ncbi:MAG: dephospho-CoA kinase [Alphaproteobacteria bacterium]|nr:dephospho-CoA kinase [Alphaproteobacteria bacterium]
MITVGLTGGIATGKSTVAGLLREQLGVTVIDADQVSREVVAPGSQGLAEIVQVFGAEVLQPDGQLDRKALGARVMGDDAARRRLEQITHPRIRGELLSQLQELALAGAPVGVVEAALLVETGSHKLYDKLIVVSCAPATQRARLISREGFAPEVADRWIASQLPLAEKEALADAVIRNEGDRDALLAATVAAWSALGLPRVAR